LTQEHWKAGLKEGLLGAGIFLAALLGVGLAGALEWRWPLLLALVATLLLVGSGLSLGLRLPWQHTLFRRATWVTLAVEVAVSAAGLGLAAALLPQMQAFVCSPLVPWKISIALLGAFAISWLTATASRAPRMKQEIPYMIVAALFWIAPFYGFFHGPWLLGQGIALSCDGRPTETVVLASAGMLIVAEVGRSSARWLWGGHQ
jgi:hypothetical protein